MEYAQPGSVDESLRRRRCLHEPSGACRKPGANRRASGTATIRELYRRRLERSPKLRFEVEDVIERPYGVIVIYRKLGVFAEQPGLTVEIFETSDGLIHRNVVYWGLEEVASRFSVRDQP